MSYFEFKRSLYRRVAEYSSNNHDFNLVVAFGNCVKWLDTPVEDRSEIGAVERLQIFLRNIASVGPMFEFSSLTTSLLSQKFAEHNAGKPKALMNLNLIEAIECHDGVRKPEDVYQWEDAEDCDDVEESSVLDELISIALGDLEAGRPPVSPQFSIMPSLICEDLSRNEGPEDFGKGLDGPSGP